MGKSILIVDDEQLIGKSLARILQADGLEVRVATSGREGLAAAHAAAPDAVILDLVLGDMDGLDVLRQLREQDGVPPKVILLTAHGSIDSAVAAMKAGAYDFIKKPFELDEVLAAVRNALRTTALESRVRYLEHDRRGPAVLLGESPAGKSMREQLKSVARSQTPSVLLLGETGSGKSLAARFLHEQSERALGQFIELNCASMDEESLEAELFGRPRVARSDARLRREGLVELADGGTLFLDEIGELPEGIQRRLVALLETGSWIPAGTDRPQRVDLRLIASTGADLRARVEAGLVREELYFRLSETTIVLPPLSDRTDDVMLLAKRFLEEAARRHQRRYRGFTAEAEALLRGYRWPGNVRELRAVMNRIVLVHEGPVIGAPHLPPEIAAGQALEEPVLPSALDAGPVPTLEEVELSYIRRVLHLCGGNKLLAARYLGIARQTLARRLNESEPVSSPAVAGRA